MEPAITGLTARLPLPYAEAVEAASVALKAEGFGVLTRIDVHDTLKAKLGVEFPLYTILGACNPPLAHKALTADPSVGLLLPCNVVVRELEGESEVSIFDPFSMKEAFASPALREVADEAGARLQRVLGHLTAGTQT